MNKPWRTSLWSAALLSLPALAFAAPSVAVNAPPPAWPHQLDSGSLALLGAGLVALALSQRLRRRF
jgi:hypothetical protein